MSKINKKNPSGKSKRHYLGTRKQSKKYQELLERYANWCSDKITKKEMNPVSFYGGDRKTFFLEERIKLLELEKERLEAMFLFYQIDCGRESEGVSLENRELRERQKKILRKKIKRINLKAKKIIASLT